MKSSPGCLRCRAPKQIKRNTFDFETPLRWREKKRIQVCPWSDFYLEQADEWRAEAWQIIRLTPWHVYYITTKFPERIPSCLPPDWGEGWPHVRLGVSIEMHSFEWRAWRLLDIPASLRYLWTQPLLSYLELRDVLATGEIGWVMCGGEHGPRYRPMRMEWALDLRDQCLGTGVPFFFRGQSAVVEGHQPWLVEPDGRRTIWLEVP